MDYEPIPECKECEGTGVVSYTGNHSGVTHHLECSYCSGAYVNYLAYLKDMFPEEYAREYGN